MRAIGRLAAELACVFLAGVLGFFAVLLLAVGTILAWMIGCASALFLLIAVAESVWWLHTHSHHAAVTALGYFGYAAGSFALIPVMFWSKDKLIRWSERRQQGTALRQTTGVKLAEDASFESVSAERMHH